MRRPALVPILFILMALLCGPAARAAAPAPASTLPRTGAGPRPAAARVARMLSAPDSWLPAGPLNTARYNHTATLLPTGEVLVVGGQDTNNQPLASAELYDPGTDSWSSAGSLSVARYGHTATLLASGEVLVAGGYNGSSYLASAELYNPANNTWTTAGNLITPRAFHSATLIVTGEVLVAGGATGGGSIASAELYDPASNSWSQAGAMLNARQGHTATLLGNGNVLVAGGEHEGGGLLTSGYASAEVYDLVSNSWSSAGSMSTTREGQAATLLNEGPPGVIVIPPAKVLVAGGTNGGLGPQLDYLSSAELYDPGANSWSTTGSMATARTELAAVQLPSKQVLVTGGLNRELLHINYLAGAELYDPTNGTWSPAASMNTARAEHTATLLPSGLVLVAGGLNSTGVLAGAELYDSGANTWSLAASMNEFHSDGTVTLLASGQVLAAGGIGDQGIYLAFAELYNPATNTWSGTGSLSVPRLG